jgi:hypothetical protein
LGAHWQAEWLQRKEFDVVRRSKTKALHCQPWWRIRCRRLEIVHHCHQQEMAAVRFGGCLESAPSAVAAAVPARLRQQLL